MALEVRLLYKFNDGVTADPAPTYDDDGISSS